MTDGAPAWGTIEDEPREDTACQARRGGSYASTNPGDLGSQDVVDEAGGFGDFGDPAAAPEGVGAPDGGGDPIVPGDLGELDDPSANLTPAHWGMYAHSDVGDAAQYDDDIVIWELDAPLTDFDTEPNCYRGQR